MQKQITFILMITVICAACLWWSDYCRRQAAANRTKNIIEVGHLLADAFFNSGYLQEALKKTARMMESDNTFLILFDKRRSPVLYLWQEAESHIKEIGEEEVTALCESAVQEEVCYHQEMPDVLKKIGIYTCVFAPIYGENHQRAGLMGCCNLNGSHADIRLLESILPGYTMTVADLQKQRELNDVKRRDRLTGLLDTNSYYSYLENIGGKECLIPACIFVDVNGLHEMNNCLGHKAGDEMLKAVAEQITDSFPEESCYRIGGDEFVIFVKDYSDEDIKQEIKKIERCLAEKNYDISVGISRAKEGEHIQELINAAEEEMRRNKRIYYDTKGDCCKNREMNIKLEQILLEKQDADTFLSVISSGFTGVYFVDIGTDTIRDIFIPDYFEAMLERSDRKFSKAIALYGNEITAAPFREEFLGFCDYDYLNQKFKEGSVPRMQYQKVDRTWMDVRVLQFKNYNDCSKDTLWIFTPVE